MVPSPRQYLTVTQAADFLGVHENTVYRWVAQGKVVHYRTPGGKIRFLETDLLGRLERIGEGVA